MTTPAIISKLASAGVVVSAGHTNATYGEIRTALEHGLTGFTHLFNACRSSPAAPGVVGAALDDPDSWCGSSWTGDTSTRRAAHRAALQAARPLHAGHRCHAQRRRDREDVLAAGQDDLGRGRRAGRREGTMAGSDTDMASTVRNAIDLLGLELTEAVRMASQYPAEFLGSAASWEECARLSREPGAGRRQMQVQATWIDGRSVRPEPRDEESRMRWAASGAIAASTPRRCSGMCAAPRLSHGRRSARTGWPRLASARRASAGVQQAVQEAIHA
jgi:N-acetylglucosamine-6-phosphate deacetylase